MNNEIFFGEEKRKLNKILFNITIKYTKQDLYTCLNKYINDQNVIDDIYNFSHCPF